MRSETTDGNEVEMPKNYLKEIKEDLGLPWIGDGQ
jgi:hypothetical protein